MVFRPNVLLLIGRDGLPKLCKIGMVARFLHYTVDMDILIRPHESLMQRWHHPADEWIVYAHRHDLEPLVTLYGADVLKIVALHFTQAQAILTLAQKTQALMDRYPQRRLLGQHKPLRGR